MGGDRARRNALRVVRGKLDAYGARNTESINDAIERLIDEHAKAQAEANQLRAENASLKSELELAKRGRTLAQQASNEMIKLSRELDADAKRVRKALEMLLRCFPVTYSEQLNDWIAKDRKRWEEMQ